MERELSKYIKSITSDQFDYLSYVELHGLEAILKNDEYLNIPALQSKIAKQIIEQEERYKLFADEIRKISEKAYLENLNLIFMKGIVIAESYFHDVGIRKSFDMDLYIDYSELHQVDLILKELGYHHLVSEKGYTNSIDYVDKYESIRNELTHVTVYHKYVDFMGALMRIDLDLHINCCHYLTKYGKNSAQSFFSRSYWKTLDVFNLRLKVLSLEDSILQLSAHFIRHYYWEYFKFLRGDFRFRVRLDLLYEMALIINKHKNELNYNELLNRAFETNQFEPLLITLFLLNEVFQSLQINNILQKYLKKYEKIEFNNGISSYFISSVLNIKPIIQMKNSGFELAEVITKEMNSIIPIRNVKYGEIDMNNNYLSCSVAYFNENLVQIDNDKIIRSSVFYRLVGKDNRFDIKWDDEDLKIELNVETGLKKPLDYIKTISLSIAKDENVAFINESINSKVSNKYYQRNAINLYINDLSDINSGVICAEIINGEKKVIEKSAILLSEMDGKFKVCITIPWDKIGFRPINRRVLKIMFYVDLLNCYDEEVYITRIFSNNHNRYKYSIFHPWTSEYCRYRLIKCQQ